VNVQGIDSYVGEIKIDDQNKIGFDLGRYSNPLREKGTKSDVVTIDNKKARIVWPEKSGTGITGVYFDSLATTPYGNIKFTLNGKDLKPESEKLVLTAIQTIKFTKEK
jgi:hypothetical protein